MAGSAAAFQYHHCILCRVSDVNTKEGHGLFHDSFSMEVHFQAFNFLSAQFSKFLCRHKSICHDTLKQLDILLQL